MIRCIHWTVLVMMTCAANLNIQAAEFDWPQWRGPHRTGISDETGLLRSWPPEGPPLLWSANGLGQGYSSVAVSNGQIYSMGKRDAQTHLMAIDSENGKLLWSTPVGEGGAPNCTPTVDGDRVYGVTHGGDLTSLDTKTGEIIWRKHYARDFGGKMMSGWGYSESPLIDGNKLICTPGAPNAMMAALDKRTGETIWLSPAPIDNGSAGRDGAAYSSIVVGQGAGVRQYVQLVGRGVVGVDAESGEVLWSYDRVANRTANVPTPIIRGDLVFCSSGYSDGGSALLRLSRRRGQIAVDEVYYRKSKQLQNHHGGMILHGNHIYMGHGHNNGFPICFELESGEEAWRPGRGPGSGSAAITLADGHLYFRYQDGIMALIEATPQSYRLKGTFPIATKNGSSWPHPVVANGCLVLRDQDDLHCYDVRQR